MVVVGTRVVVGGARVVVVVGTRVVVVVGLTVVVTGTRVVVVGKAVVVVTGTMITGARVVVVVAGTVVVVVVDGEASGEAEAIGSEAGVIGSLEFPPPQPWRPIKSKVPTTHFFMRVSVCYLRAHSGG